jgi:hypothetical protein
VELWLRLQLNVSENGPVDLVATVTQDSVELAQVKFTLARKDLTLGGDEGTIQVLVRSPLDHVSIKNGSRLSIAITRPTGPETVSIWGVCSHIEFRDNRSRPDRCQNTYAVRRVASKAADPEIPPLNLSSLTAPAPVIPQSRPQSASTESAPAPAAPTLPADFAFAGLTKVDGPTDIDNVLKGKVTLTIAAGGSELLLSSERDSVRGLHGRGLRIGQRNTGNVLEGTFRLRFIWTPEPFACYRDRRLLGIWDPGRNKLRMPEADEAPAILPEENDKGSKDDHQRENQESANEKRENEWGVWTRADGQNRTEARFLKFQDSKVHLEKRDGSVVRVSMNALSKGDQEYVRNTLRLRRAEQTKKGIREGVR